MPKIEVPFRRFAVWMILAAVGICSGSLARADSSTANLSVTVTDSSGAVIPGAHLVLRNADTNREQQNESSKSGSATFPFLKPGHYKLTVSKDAFADVVIDHILLNVGDDKFLQLSLKVGSPSQTVNVDGSGLTINTTDASVSTMVDRKFVENAPLNGRSFQDLISMTPGVITQSPQTAQNIGANGDFSVNGQRTESNYYMVDGVTGNVGSGLGSGVPQAATSGSVAASTALGTTQSLVSVDALQEFRVQSSSYSAEYGRSPGGQFSFATRSGTNSLHGTAFDYLRNNFFDANDWFNDYYGKQISALRQNDFGGTLGGPITIPGLYNGRDKSFFFTSYEGLRLTQPQPAAIQYVPDTNLRNGAAAALQPILNAFPIQNGKEELVPCTQGPTSAYPCPSGNPTGTSVKSGLADFIKVYSIPSRIDSTSVRVDHVFHPRLLVFFRFGDTPSSVTSRTLSSINKSVMNTQTYTLGATSQLSRRVANEFRLGYSRADSTQTQSIDSFGGATAVDLASATGLSGYSNGYASVGLTFSGIGNSSLTAGPSASRERQWNLVDTVSTQLGNHSFKFGLDYRHIKTSLNAPSPLLYASFSTQASLVNDSISFGYVYKFLPATPLFNQFSAFAQDEWHVAQQLNLSLGLRWEVNPPPTEAHGNDAFTLLGTLSNPSSLSVAPRGTALWKTTWYNFAPRLGAAWTALRNPGWETVVRSGAGVFFDTDDQLGANGYYLGLGFTAYKYTSGTPLPVTATQLAFSPSVTAPYTSTVVYAFPQHLQLPYTLGWNVSLQQALGRSQALTFSYVGSNGRRLLQQQQLSLTSLNPNFGAVRYVTGNITSNYQSLQVQFQRSIAHGFQALTAYTWSHSIDLGSNYSALPLTRGNSDFDVRHNFQAGATWDLPSVKTSPLVSALLNQWGLDGRLMVRTGFPVTLSGNYLTDPATGSHYYTNVDLVQNQPIYLHGSKYPGGRAINRAAFSLPVGTNLGNAPRNFVRGFDAVQVNLAARRDFHIYESLTLQFRAEAFNVLNHPNFGYVDPALTDATFGLATKMLNQSLGTVSSQYQQGGPRSMQFALKLLF
jgi:hypothetical protein